MAGKFAHMWGLAFPTLIALNLASAQAQEVSTGNQSALNRSNNLQYAGDTRYFAQDQPAPAAAPEATPAAATDTGCCPKCGGGCGKCDCDNCGCCFVWDRDTWVKVGAGLRTSFNTLELNTPGGDSKFNFFNPDNMRLYFSGQGHQYIGFEFNTEIDDPNQSFTSPNNLAELRILDAVIKFQMSDLFNVWVGRFLPPSDRANLDGPFFLNAWDFPFVQNYPAIFGGRDTGAAYWGQVGGGTLKWQIGAFNGTGRDRAGVLGPNPSGNMLFAGRVTLNLLDPEPGYYNQSTYYGKKDILAIGIAAQSQKDGVGVAGAPADFFGWNVDFLFEKKLDNDGVITLEAAYYDYQDQGAPDAPLPTGGPNARRLQQGEASFVELSYLMADEFAVGRMCGRFQPFARWQNYNHDFKADAAAAGAFEEGLDFGTNYIISGHNARLTAFWGERDIVGGNNYTLFRTGAQIQF